MPSGPVGVAFPETGSRERRDAAMVRWLHAVNSIALVFISALGEPRSNWLAVAGVAAFMALFGVLLFIWGLGLPVNAFGPR